jgi:AraC-like DNA-binding protein
VLHGAAHEYTTARDFLPQLREAIVSLRQLELRLPQGAAGPRTIPYHEELQSNALALRELRTSGRPGPAFEAWIELVFERHQRRLHDLRLRLFEMLAVLSSSVDAGQQLGYVIQSGFRRLLDAYTLPQLREVMRAAAGEAAALVALQSGGQLGSGDEASPLVKRALGVIHARYTEPVSLAEIAAAVHASPEHLAREFRRRLGRTVVEALQLLRVNHARQLLTETDRTVLDVAFSSGFESAEHFYRTFRKLAGTTPKAYRQRHTR